MPNITTTGRVGSEAARAAGHVFVDVFHALLPWAMWIALTFAGLALRLGFGKDRILVAALVALAGTVLAALDWHLRRHRMSMVGKLIGPATTVAGSVITVYFLTQGFSQDLAAVYLVGGAVSCIIWDVWLHHADKHDFALAFPAAAERAGAGRARLTVRARPAVPGARQRPRLTGSVRFPPGEVSPDEAAERTAHLEGGLGYPPGAFTMTPDARDAAGAEFIISDPRTLDEPLPWPGPSAPGGSVAHPFRLGGRQDGDPFLVDQVPVFQARGMGKTGSGKTMSWLWNTVAEGVTRRDYAAVAGDGNKGLQFLGPLQPALHQTAVTEDAVMLLLARLHLAREMRIAYLASKHMTEWQPGCGLVYLEAWLEEAPSIWAKLKQVKVSKPGQLSMQDWLEDVKADRTAGIALRASLQEALHTEMPTVARAQMSPVCFGVDSRKDAELGLSERQMKAGCQPQLWGSSRPGTAYADLPTMDYRDVTMPVRFYDWGRDAHQIAAYMADWPAAGRPLDPVTAEALAWEPAAGPASEALPGPGGRLAGSAAPRDPANVIRPRISSWQPSGVSAPQEAETIVRRILLGWYAAGKTTFTAVDLSKDKVDEQAGRSRPWLYQLLDAWTREGLLEVITVNPKRTRKALKTWETKLSQAERARLGLEDKEEG